jgi:hypothetical protein
VPTFVGTVESEWVLVGLKAVAMSAMVPPFPQVTAAMVPLTTACKEVLREARSG